MSFGRGIDIFVRLVVKCGLVLFNFCVSMRLNGIEKGKIGRGCEVGESLDVRGPEGKFLESRIRSIVAAVSFAVFAAGCGGKFHYPEGGGESGGGDEVEISSEELNAEEEDNEVRRRELLEEREKLIYIIRILDERVEWARLVIEGVDKAQKLAERRGRVIEDFEDIKIRIEGWIEIYEDLRNAAAKRLEAVEGEMGSF